MWHIALIVWLARLKPSPHCSGPPVRSTWPHKTFVFSFYFFFFLFTSHLTLTQLRSLPPCPHLAEPLGRSSLVDVPLLLARPLPWVARPEAVVSRPTDTPVGGAAARCPGASGRGTTLGMAWRWFLLWGRLGRQGGALRQLVGPWVGLQRQDKSAIRARVLTQARGGQGKRGKEWRA